MTVIQPCRLCPLREGCEQRDEFRKRVAGINAASVRFHCVKLAAQIRPGRRIQIDVPDIDADTEPYDYTSFKRRVTATIHSVRSDMSFSCIVDPGQIDEDMVTRDVDLHKVRFRRTQAHHRIRAFLDEPDGEFCEQGQLRRGDECNVLHGTCYCKEMQGWP